MKIKEIRKKLDLSQANFAKLLGVHQTAVSQWETGKTFPEMEIVLRIAQLSGRSVNDVLDVPGGFENPTDRYRDAFELVMPDDSMRSARIYKGDTVYFMPIADTVESGMIAAVEMDDRVVIRYLYPAQGGYLLVASPGDAPPEFVGKNVRILGRAYAFRGSIS